MTTDLLLYTASTMNGWKPVIFLEEAQIPYDLRPIDFDRQEQKSEWYLKLNPNGRIPTLVDRGNDDFVVFESGAILWYLAEKYGRFLSSDPAVRSETLQWLMFQHGGLGPMMGQAMYFQRIAQPNGQNSPFSIQRYVKESRRLLEVLNSRLDGRAYLAGDCYSIADMATYPWAKCHYWAKVSVDGLTHLQRWLTRLDERPLTQKALCIPEPFPAFYGQGEIDSSIAQNASRFKQTGE